MQKTLHGDRCCYTFSQKSYVGTYAKSDVGTHFEIVFFLYLKTKTKYARILSTVCVGGGEDVEKRGERGRRWREKKLFYPLANTQKSKKNGIKNPRIKNDSNRIYIILGVEEGAVRVYDRHLYK